MGLNKVVRRKRHSELLAEIGDSLGFMLATAVGKQDEGNVIIVEELQRFAGSGDRFRDMEEDAIDAGLRK